MRKAPRTEETGENEEAPSISLWHTEAGALLVRIGVVLVVLAVAGASIVGLNHFTQSDQGTTSDELPALSIDPAPVEPGSEVPGSSTIAAAAGEPDEQEVTGQDEVAEGEEHASVDELLQQWAEELGPELGVPPRALIAYGRAELAAQESHPNCEVSWATLAGIGRIESQHGQYGGAVLGDDGVPSEPIIGVALDGSSGVQSIPDTDGGHYDGDPDHDRAVGPMQFIPGTWAKFAADGTGNGEAHPQQIDDAALSAAHYLCADQRSMSSGDGWWSGVLAYNNSVEYGQRVFAVADQYASGARSMSRQD